MKPRHSGPKAKRSAADSGYAIGDASLLDAAQQALRESEARFRALSDLSADSYWEQDDQHRFTRVIPSSSSKTIVVQQSWLGKTRWELPYIGMSEEDWRAHREILARRQPFRDLVLKAKNAAGLMTYVNVSGYPVVDSQGVFKGYRGIAKNISVAKRGEQMLALEHRVTRCLADADDASAGLGAVIQALCLSESWEGGRYWRVDGDANVLRSGESWTVAGSKVERFFAASHDTVFGPGIGMVGRAWQSGQPQWIADIGTDSETSHRALARDFGVHGSFGLPVIADGNTIGVLAFASSEVREPDDRLLAAARVIGSQVGQFLQRKRAQEHLGLLVRAREVMAECSRALARTADEQQLRQEMCRIVVESGGYSVAWIGLVQHDEGRTIERVASAGDVRFLEWGRISWGDDEYGQGTVGIAVRSGVPQAVRDIRTSPGFSMWRDRALAFGHRSAAALPLIYAGETLGVLAIFAAKPEAFDLDKMELLEELANDIAYGMYNLRARAAQQRGEAELRESELRFQATFDQMAVGIAHVDDRGQIMLANRRLEEILGYDRGELLGRVIRALSHPDDVNATDSGRARLTAGDIKTFTTEKRFLRKNGSQVWVSVTVSRARPAGSTAPYDIAVFEDIDERKRRDEDSWRFRIAMDASPDAIYLVDRASMRIVDANATACRALGYTREELLAARPETLISTSREELERAYDAVIAGGGEAAPLEIVRRHKDGSHALVEVRRRAQISEAGWMIITVARDITERKRADDALREGEARFRSLTELSSDMYWEQDEQYRFTSFAGAGTRRITEAIVKPIGRKRWDQNYVNMSVQDWDAHIGVLDARQRYHDLELCRLNEAGEKVWISVSGEPMFDDAGAFRGYRGVGKDITARKQAEQNIKTRALQQSVIAAFGQRALANSDLDELVEQSVLVIAETLDAEFCQVLEVSPDGESLILRAGTGWGAEWIGRKIMNVRSRTPPGEALKTLEPVICADVDEDSRFDRTELGRVHGIRNSISVVIPKTDGAFGVLGIHSRQPRSFGEQQVSFMHSIANTLAAAIDRKAAEQKLTNLAQFDALTGLPNRNLLRDRLGQMLAQAQRNNWQVGVMFVDLDRFKAVNDTYGHGVGDKLLTLIAQRLKECVRGGDTVGRLAGDEFAIVLSSLAKGDDASLVSQKVIAALARPFDLEGHETYMTASLGIALYPVDGVDPDVLLKNADTAMYRAKEQGRNNYQFYLPQMNERAVERLVMETQLRGALERNEFLLYYQPKAHMDSGEISGFEALLRWQHPQRGLVPPVLFISILEDTGLIVPVGEWVVREVCEQLMRWQAGGITPRPVAVNLSARQFQQKNLDATIGAILKETGVDPRLLEFELTESLLMNDAEEAVITLRNLKAYGVRLAIDDFGTGYSSLAYLKRFPLDALKIDRAFIREVTTDPDDATIAQTIITLAHSLKLQVVAEGVETEAQLDFLRIHGCDEMQGYYFSLPLPIEDCTRALVENRRLEAPLPWGPAAADAVLVAG